MAEEEKKENADEESPKRDKKVILLIAIVVFLVAFLLIFLFLPEEKKRTRRSSSKVIVLEIEDPDKVLSGGVYRTSPFIVNLRENSGILRISIVIEFYDFEAPKEDRSIDAAIRDAVITVAGSYLASELVRPEIKEQLKNNLINLLEERLPEENPPHYVYFEEFNIQPAR